MNGGLEDNQRIPSVSEAQREMDEALTSAQNAPPPQAPQPDRPSDEEIAVAEETARSPQKLGQWRSNMHREISTLSGRIAPEIEEDLRTKVNSANTADEIASPRLHIAALASALQ